MTTAPGATGPTRVPAPVQPPLNRADVCGQFERLDGRRAVVSNVEGATFGMRAVGGLYPAGGYLWLNVATEHVWWSHRLGLGGLVTVPWPAGAVWVE